MRSLIILPMLAAMLSPLSGADTISYRLEKRGPLDFSVLPEFQGEKSALKLTVLPGSGEAGGLLLAEPKHLPLAPSIPPYIRSQAIRFTAKLWVEQPGDIENLRFVFKKQDAPSKVLRIKPDSLSAGKWTTVLMENPDLGSIQNPLLNVRLEARSAGKDATLYLASPVLETSTGASYNLLNPEPTRVITGSETPLATAPARPLPQRNTLAMGGYLVELSDWAADIPAMAEYMKAKFPEYDFVLAPVWTPPTVVAERLKELPEGVFFQFQKARFDHGYLSATDGFPKNADGQQLKDFDNTVVATNPVVRQALKDEIDYAASLGVNLFKQVDYTWPYFGGRWGYDDYSVASYREDLLGKDEGLELLPGAEGDAGGRIHFLDYFEKYHGFRPKPQDLGLKSWAEYTPVSEAIAASGSNTDKLNLGIFVALFHYEWLRQAQRFGEWAEARQGRHDFTLNPEDVCNGGDYVFLARLKHAGIPYVEFFGGPATLYSAYASLPFYVQAARLAGKKLGLITEIGQGGHGQNYLDLEIGYLLAYELSALGLQNYQNEWMEAPWRVMSDPANAYHYDRFAAWMSQALGFVNAQREKTTRQAAPVFNVSMRSSVNYMQNWLWSLSQMDSFGPLLADRQVNFEQTDSLYLGEAAKTAQTIFYSSPANRPSDGVILGNWLATGGKTLVTHSYLPVSIDNGQALLAQGVQNVEYRGEDKNYSDFLKINHSQDFALLPQFQKLSQAASGKWQLPGVSRWRLIAGTKDAPRVSSLELPKGSRIVYAHDRLDSLSKEERAQLMEEISRAVDLPVLATASDDSRVMAHRFSNAKADVVVLWNRAELDKLGFFGGYGPHLLPDRGPDKFDAQVRPYPYHIVGASCTAKVPVAASGNYKVYRFLEDREETLAAGADKLLELTVKDAVVEQFYIAPDSPGFAEEVARLKAARQDAAPFFTANRR